MTVLVQDEILGLTLHDVPEVTEFGLYTTFYVNISQGFYFNVFIASNKLLYDLSYVYIPSYLCKPIGQGCQHCVKKKSGNFEKCFTLLYIAEGHSPAQAQEEPAGYLKINNLFLHKSVHKP